MGITAENICEKWGLTREELDEFAAWSQQKTVAAQEAGKFDDEIVPVEVKKKKETIIFKKDEGPRPGTMMCHRPYAAPPIRRAAREISTIKSRFLGLLTIIIPCLLYTSRCV